MLDPSLAHTGPMAYLGSGSQWQPPAPQWQPPPPVDPASADSVYRWFKVYVAVMALICVAVVAVAFLIAVFGVDASATDATEQRVYAAIYGVAALIPLGVYAVGLFLPRKPWGWVYGIVLLSLGLTSCCLWPAAIPLLIGWLKPGMKARFHRS